jgi:hypothetical protein
MSKSYSRYLSYVHVDTIYIIYDSYDIIRCNVLDTLSATTLSRLPLGSQDVRQISNIRRFVCVDIHKPNGFEVERTGNQGEQFQFSRMASSRKEGTVLTCQFTIESSFKNQRGLPDSDFCTQTN